jgi:hypothetical protein
MMVEQQPVMHPVPGRHWLGSMPPGPQACDPAGHSGGGGVVVPPSMTGPQSAGSVGLPMQISQCSQGFAHWVTWVQGGQAVGSPNLCRKA